MTLLVVLGCVATYLLLWFVAARLLVGRWHARGGVLHAEGLCRTRKFSRPEDRGWIAWYALLATCVWPLVLPFLLAARFVFVGVDKRDRRAERLRLARADELRSWHELRRTATSDAERRVADEVLASLDLTDDRP
jgi:hypothetical protein